jgi:hypothetical protein
VDRIWIFRLISLTMEEGGNANVFKYLYHHFSLPFILCTIMRHDRIQLHLLASCSDLIPAINMCAITSRPTAQDRYTKCTLNSHARSVVMDVLLLQSVLHAFGPELFSFCSAVRLRAGYKQNKELCRQNEREIKATVRNVHLLCLSCLSILASRQRSR